METIEPIMFLFFNNDCLDEFIYGSIKKNMLISAYSELRPGCFEERKKKIENYISFPISNPNEYCIYRMMLNSASSLTNSNCYESFVIILIRISFDKNEGDADISLTL